MQDRKAKERQEEVKGEGQARQAHVDGAGGSSQAHFPHAAVKKEKQSDCEAQQTFKYHCDEIFTSCCTAITNTRVDQKKKRKRQQTEVIFNHQVAKWLYDLILYESNLKVATKLHSWCVNAMT